MIIRVFRGQICSVDDRRAAPNKGYRPLDTIVERAAALQLVEDIVPFRQFASIDRNNQAGVPPTLYRLESGHRHVRFETCGKLQECFLQIAKDRETRKCAVRFGKTGMKFRSHVNVKGENLKILAASGLCSTTNQRNGNGRDP